MRRDDVRVRDLIAIHEPVYGLAVTPGLGLIGRAAIGPGRHLLTDQNETLGPPLIAKVTCTKVPLRPGR